MSKLFIIGNGFDLAHKLDTRYKDFKKFMYENAYGKPFDEDRQEEIEPQMPALPEGKIFTKKGTIYNFAGAMRLLYWMINKVACENNDIEWNEFEALLQKLDYAGVLLECEKTEDRAASRLRDVFETLEHVFFEWISEVDISKDILKKPYLERVMNQKEVLVLSFNYTETVEKVYGVCAKNVCHIHGKREENYEKRLTRGLSSFGEDNSRLIVGYAPADFKPEEKFNANIKNSDLYGRLVFLYSLLQKDVGIVMSENESFYDGLRTSNIHKVYSYGYSYPEEDKVQIQEVCKALKEGNQKPESIVWYLHQYDEENKNFKFEKKLREWGFQGDFGRYSDY
ncbi:MAG: bacteriophage abortive infection AbiH family protein [Lachnospiraceae bacterium]|nr:bacteriophage abortive infection AbiH family protein [Lachnospiraceae bacterium]